MSEWLDTKAAALHVGFEPKTLENWRSAERGPSFRRIGRAIRYNRAELDRFMNENGRAA